MLSRRASLALFVPVLAVLVGYVLFPSLRTFVAGLGVENWSTFLAGRRSANVRALLNSVGISAASVLGAGVVGTGLAYVFFRFQFPLRRVLRGLAVAPLALPPLVGVLAFLFLLGESGILPRLVQVAAGLDRVPFAFEGRWAVWVVHVYSMYVYFYLFCAAAFRGIDRSVLEAATDLGASSFTTFRTILFPLLRPALVSASLLVFMISMASFTAPLLFAGTEPFLTLQIYNYKTNGDLALSATVSTMLTAICLVFLLLLEWRDPRRRGTAAKGLAAPPQAVRKGWARSVAWVLAAVIVLVLSLPIATVVLLSFAEEGSWTVEILPRTYSLSNYAALVTDSQIVDPIRNSLAMASLATAANLLFGVATALIVVKGRLPGRALVRVLSALPFAIPGTVIALNLILAFNEAGPLSFGQVLVGTYWILPLAYFIRHIPLVVRSTSAVLETFDDPLTEASSDLGAPAWTTFRRIVWPSILPGVLAGGLLTFVTSLGEFVSSIMLYIYGNRPISVEILSQLRLFDFGAAAAYSVLLIGLIALSAWLAQRLGGEPV